MIENIERKNINASLSLLFRLSFPLSTPTSSSLPFPSLLQAFALAYILLAIVTTRNVDWLRNQPRPAQAAAEDSALPTGRAFNAVLAALILSMVVLISNAVWSLVVLLKSTASGSKLAGFAHGSTLASTFHIAAFMILTGCVLNAFSAGVKSIEESSDGTSTSGIKGWGRNDSDAFNATFVLAFIVAGLHIVLWAMLLTCRSAFVKTATVAV
jgi:hypothetical protein